MARSPRAPRRLSARQYRLSPQHLPPYHRLQGRSLEEEHPLNKAPISPPSNALKNDWEDATCSVCMEFPHNAVLLLCSSHDKGCRPYMCGTSFLYSNCLDQYKKAYTKILSPDTLASTVLQEKPEVAELSCPLCRGQVKGWTVVERARSCLNSKKRTCMQDNCSYVGNYKELRRHMKAAHPRAKPREVDPMLEQRWRRLEREREHEDVISVIRSSTPGAVVWGDYVIEGGGHGGSHGGGAATDDEGYGGEGVDGRHDGEGNPRGFDPSILYVLSLFRAFENSNSSLASRLRRIDRGSPRLPFLQGDNERVDASWEVDGDEDGEMQPYRHARAAGTIERRRRRRRRSRSYTRQGTDVDDP